jgi:hypothetical protein
VKDLAVVRYPYRGSAKALKSALSLYFHGPASAACVLALSIVIWLIPRVGIASEALEQRFDGVVVPCQWVQVVPQVNGVGSCLCLGNAFRKETSYSRWTPMTSPSMYA